MAYFLQYIKCNYLFIHNLIFITMKNKIFRTTINCPNSKQIFLGDICYALNENIYSEVWGDLNYQDGIIKDDIDTYGVVVGTAHGDGCYRSNTGHIYPVDAGVIGVTNMDYQDENNFIQLGYLVNIPNGICECVIKYTDGVISIDIYDDKHNKIIYEKIDTNW